MKPLTPAERLHVENTLAIMRKRWQQLGGQGDPNHETAILANKWLVNPFIMLKNRLIESERG